MPQPPDLMDGEVETNPVAGELLRRALAANPLKIIILNPVEREYFESRGIDSDTIAGSVSRLSNHTVFVSGL